MCVCVCLRVTTHTPPASGLEGRHAGRPPGRVRGQSEILEPPQYVLYAMELQHTDASLNLYCFLHILACIGAHMSDKEALLEVAHFESRAEGH